MYCNQENDFFFNDTATTEIYTLSLHDALPICLDLRRLVVVPVVGADHEVVLAGVLQEVRDIVVGLARDVERSEEHTSELQSRQYLVCRLLLEKKQQDQLLFD